jgi:hypothetical protein
MPSHNQGITLLVGCVSGSLHLGIPDILAQLRSLFKSNEASNDHPYATGGLLQYRNLVSLYARKGGDNHQNRQRPLENLGQQLQQRGLLMTKRETEVIEQLANEAEPVIETDYEKKDMKEKRALNKQTLYNGSKKLKHSVPKGKRI